jgi:predicted nuclease with RNAse H fold
MPVSDFIGLDLTSSPNQASACIGLDEDLRLIFLGLLCNDTDIIAALGNHSPHLVAIDAPLTMPQGLCCLEESCSCQPEQAKKGRECERGLAKLGIPSYFTTKRSIIRSMVYRGLKIRNELKGRGFEVIEVYPYASKIRLWGKPIPSKLKPAGLDFLRSRLATLIPCLTPYVADFNHDLCDAVIAAYTAYLHYSGKTEPIGDPEEGAIHIPKKNFGLTLHSLKDKIGCGKW